uniref:Uncharacterized protein n=1 Tax=Geobacter sp. (strain M21) TaxID=443144 RepID=C6E6T5_GEOSM
MTRPHVMAMVIITRDSLTIKAFEQDGKNVLEEIRRKGEVLDCVNGNFEDEPSLSEDLFLALEEIKCAALEVMDTLNPI